MVSWLQGTGMNNERQTITLEPGFYGVAEKFTPGPRKSACVFFINLSTRRKLWVPPVGVLLIFRGPDVFIPEINLSVYAGPA